MAGREEISQQEKIAAEYAKMLVKASGREKIIGDIPTESGRMLDGWVTPVHQNSIGTLLFDTAAFKR